MRGGSPLFRGNGRLPFMRSIGKAGPVFVKIDYYLRQGATIFDLSSFIDYIL
jgi:hypothetical protein